MPGSVFSFFNMNCTMWSQCGLDPLTHPHLKWPTNSIWPRLTNTLWNLQTLLAPLLEVACTNQIDRIESNIEFMWNKLLHESRMRKTTFTVCQEALKSQKMPGSVFQYDLYHGDKNELSRNIIMRSGPVYRLYNNITMKSS